MKKNIILALVATLFLSSCTSIPEILNISSSEITKSKLELPSVDVLSSRKIKYIVVTPENVADVWKELENSKTDLVLFALTDNGYENLSLNVADIIKLVKQQQAIIIAYQQYYETGK
jgi:hypothetical protein